jgi:hypothetical protein
MKNKILNFSVIGFLAIIIFASCGPNNFDTRLTNINGTWSNVTCNSCQSRFVFYNDGSFSAIKNPAGPDGAYLYNFNFNNQQIDLLKMNGSFIETIFIQYDGVNYYFDLPIGSYTYPNGNTVQQYNRFVY